jgi:DNA-binding winged helix-turn-helix (wHTH) protein
VQVPANGPRRLGFGLFEADLLAHELYRRGVLIHVQDQPFQILAMLLERPGEVITREELRERLWPGDTFVEFDEGLNTAVKKLRYALGDSPDNPTFIETIPRRGYRFIAPTRVLDGAASLDVPENGQQQTGELAGLIEALKYSNPARESPATTIAPSDPPQDDQSSEQPSQLPEEQRSLTVGAEPSPHKSHAKAVWTLAVFLCALGVGLGTSYLRRTRSPDRSMHFSVALPVAVRDLALSHDGRILAFVAPLPKIGATALWVIEVGGAGSRALPNTEGAAYPFWSPDDRSIAFFADGKLKKVPASGGAVQVICDVPDPSITMTSGG